MFTVIYYKDAVLVKQNGESLFVILSMAQAKKLIKHFLKDIPFVWVSTEHIDGNYLDSN